MRRRIKRNPFIKRNKSFSVTTWIIIISIIVSIITFILAAFSENYLNYLALKPTNILQGKFLWTLLTHMFAHGGILHLFINMFVLFSLGGLSEKIIGRKRFLWFYIISGLFAGALSVVLSGFFGHTDLGARIFGSPDIFMVGASGAIFAIAGLYVILLPKLKFMIIFLPFFSFPAYIIIPAALVIMWIASIIGNWPVGNVAHFGGFLIGIIYGLYLRQKYRRKVQRLQHMFR
jgi:uncharacterized protein